MGKYPIVKRNMERGMKVAISSVYVCGNLHRSFEVIYSVPGDWAETALKWCDNVAAALVEVLVNEYVLVESDFLGYAWIRA